MGLLRLGWLPLYLSLTPLLSGEPRPNGTQGPHSECAVRSRFTDGGEASGVPLWSVFKLRSSPQCQGRGISQEMGGSSPSATHEKGRWLQVLTARWAGDWFPRSLADGIRDASLIPEEAVHYVVPRALSHAWLDQVFISGALWDLGITSVLVRHMTWSGSPYSGIFVLRT